MSAIRISFLGSSSTVGTGLTNPTTERYEALFRTYIRGARSSHCRTAVYAVAGMGIYEQQVTGYAIPGNRSGVVSVDTSNNVTAALSFKPHILILHHPAGNMPEAIGSWGFTTESALKGFMDSEQDNLVVNIYNACLSAGVEFRVMGSHPVTSASLSAEEQAANLNVVRKYWNDKLKARWGSRFIEYWSAIDDGTGNGNASLLTSNGRHCNTSGIAAGPEPALEAAGISTFNNRLTALDIDP